MGSAVAPLLVHIATTQKDPEVVCAAINAMTAMAAWPEGRCELRICGCLRVLEVCAQSSDHNIRCEGFKMLGNLAIDQVINSSGHHSAHVPHTKAAELSLTNRAIKQFSEQQKWWNHPISRTDLYETSRAQRTGPMKGAPAAQQDFCPGALHPCPQSLALSLILLFSFAVCAGVHDVFPHCQSADRRTVGRGRGRGGGGGKMHGPHPICFGQHNFDRRQVP